MFIFGSRARRGVAAAFVEVGRLVDLAGCLRRLDDRREEVVNAVRRKNEAQQKCSGNFVLAGGLAGSITLSAVCQALW